MPPKRKRGIATPVPSESARKRAKNSKQRKPIKEDDEREYACRAILNEKKVKNQTHYLLDWLPNSRTGEIYDPTWEPARNVADDLIDEWNKTKSLPLASQQSSLSPAQKKQRGRPRRIIESDESSPPSFDDPTKEDASREIAETQPTTSPGVYVDIPRPTPSYYQGDYVDVASFSQIQPLSEKSTQSEPSGSQYIPTQNESIVLTSNGTSQENIQATGSVKVQSSAANTSEDTSGLFVPDSQSGLEGTSTSAQDHALPTTRDRAAHPCDHPVDVAQDDASNRPESSGHGTEHPAVNQAPYTQSGLQDLQSISSHRPPQAGTVDGRPNLSLQTTYSSQPAGSTQASVENLLSTSFQRPVDPSPLGNASSVPLSQPLRAQSEANPTSAELAASVPSGPSSLPIGLSSPFEPTPSVLLVPSQPLHIGPSAPSRPSTLPSIETMDREAANTAPRSTATDASPRSSGLGGMLKARREAQQERLRIFKEERARREGAAPSINNEAPLSPVVANPVIALNVAQENPASPAAIPAVEPPPVISQEEMNTSERYGTLIPDTDDSNEQALTDIAGITAQAEVQRHEDGIQLIPIAMTGHQRDQYPQEVIFNEAVIAAFLDVGMPDEKAINAADQFVQRLCNIAIHPDLINLDTLTPPDKYDAIFGPQALAQWDKDASAKFRFLSELYQRLQSTALDVAIMCSNAMIADKVKALLTNIGARVYTPGDSFPRDNLNFVIINTQGDIVPSSPVDLVIGMDHTLTQEQMVSRGLLRQDGRLTRPIALIVPKSVEHIELSLSETLPRHTYLRLLLNSIRQYRREAGKTVNENETVSKIAATLAKFLTSEQESEWNVPSITVLHDLDSQTQTELSIQSEKGKRKLDEGQETHKSKRVRLETPELQDSILTRISDSAKDPNSDLPSSEPNDVQSLQQLLRQTRERCAKAEEKVFELTEALEGLQYRFEDQRQMVSRLTGERDGAMETAERATTQLNKFMDAGAARRAELASVKERLQEAQTALATHALPERAELESMRAAWRAETVAREKAEARVKSVEGERDYAQAGYQTATTQATEFLQQNRELEKQVEEWQRRSSSQPTHLRQLHLDTHAVMLQKENKRLKVQLTERETLLKLRDEEIAKMREASRGRMGTRGNSIPRSPRMGSPLKLATDGRGRHSRAGSPAKAGNGSPHPLRNG